MLLFWLSFKQKLYDKIIKNYYVNFNMGIGDWGLGIGPKDKHCGKI